MNWHCLGHACWLAEATGLRLLFDPLIDSAHHGGVFEVFPRREIDAVALRPDFVFVSHRHPDHFDVASLAMLARLDPDTVVVTPDALVADCAARLGFRVVRQVAPETHVSLDGPQIVTTPSRGASDPEWGVLVATEEGVVWNQVDTSPGSPRHVKDLLARAAAGFGRSTSADLVTLALARWQPLLEVEAMLAGPIGFPTAAYGRLLDTCAAAGARVVCPASSGARHAGPFAFMNRLVYPIGEARFASDLSLRQPGVRVEAHTVGATYRVRGGDVEIDPRGASELVTRIDEGAIDDRDFRPLEIPPLVDPNLDGRPEPALRARAEAWVRGALAPALARTTRATTRHVLEIVFAGGTDVYAIRAEGGGAAIELDHDPGWDLRCAVAGSLLVDVVEGRRHWGDLLLGGMLRACSRAYTVGPAGLEPRALQPLFVYHAISYDESVRRAVDFAVSQA